MAITISGENNNDRILASDGVIDSLSGFNVVGVITATSFTGDLTGDVTGNLTGNVTGNINNSTLLLQTGGSERIRITGNNEIGIAGANYGSAGQVLTSSGSGSAVSWTTIPTQVTINNNAANRIITGEGGTTLNGEANLTWDGNKIHATATGEIARFQSTNSVSTIRLYSTASGHTEIGHTEDTYIAVGGAERLRITSTGTVGINESSPLARLHVKNGESNANGYAHDTIVVEDSDHAFLTFLTGTSGSSGINFGDAGDPQRGVIQYDQSNDYMRFITAAGERLRITSDGFIRYAPSNMQIFADSSDGSDDHYLNLSGGGACSQTRGAQVVMYGNEKSNEQGRLLLMAGNSGNTNGSIDFYSGGSKKTTITSNGRVHIRPSNTFYAMNSQSTDLVIGDGGGGRGITFWTAGAADNQTISFQCNENLSRAEGEISYGPTATSVTNDRNAMMFRTNSAERLRIGSNGKINCSYENPGNAAYGNLEITKNGTSNVDPNWSYLCFHRVGRVGFQQGLIVDDLVFATTGGAAKNTLQYERFRIKSDGTGVVLPQNARLESAPNSSWSAGLYVGGNGNAASSTHGSMAVTNGNLHLDAREGTYGVYLNWYGGTTGTYFGTGGSSQAGRIDASGNLTLSGSYPGSDLRLKENIQNISGATDTIKSLVGKTFTWKTEAGLDDWKHYGFIAQEVQKVAPDLVKSIGCHYFDKDDKLVTDIDPTESDEDRKNKGITQSLTVNNEGVTPILVEAMKELIAKVETLEAKVATLEGS